MLTICGQTGGPTLFISVDVPRTQPSNSRPRPPTKPPRERNARKPPPTFELKAWRVFADISFRDLADLTGFDAATIKRAEDRAAGKKIKNDKKGVEIGLLYALVEVYGLSSIEALRRKPEDPPSEVERFVAAPPEWREDFMRMIDRLPKQEQ